eukprot:GILI01011224.1.p1 GENE.GILI01011224.1~~GILI01011224.1.p1  ORF type:complete len:932 (-),score=126.28 GILI01011224.1:811-3606(-)
MLKMRESSTVYFCLVLCLLYVPVYSWRYVDVDPTNWFYQECRSGQNEEDCLPLPEKPSPRRGHTMVVYWTWTEDDVNNLCPGYQCGPFCNTTDVSCWVDRYPRLPADEMAGGRRDLPAPTGDDDVFYESWSHNCPSECCNAEENCFRLRDNFGQVVIPDEEVLLMYGGKAAQQRLYNGEMVYITCPSSYDERDIDVHSCGEQVVSEIWRYFPTRDVWDLIKLDYHRQMYEEFYMPSPRYGHSAAVVKTTEYVVEKKTYIDHLYMYVYGGVGPLCVDYCDDLWRYEIPFAAKRYYFQPARRADWWKSANFWEPLLPTNNSRGPGKRWKHSMVSDSKGDLYVFGGSRYREYLDDLWKYWIVLDKWEKINPLGIVVINRSVMMWMNSPFKYTVDIEYLLSNDNVTWSRSNSSLPGKRFGAAMTVWTPEGDTSEEPPWYLFLFGGYRTPSFFPDNDIANPYPTYDSPRGYYLNDFWVYRFVGEQWIEIKALSSDIPEPRVDARLTSWRDILILTGGRSQDDLATDFWIYNITTNTWTKMFLFTDYTTFDDYSYGDIIYNITQIQTNTSIVDNNKDNYLFTSYGYGSPFDHILRASRANYDTEAEDGWVDLDAVIPQGRQEHTIVWSDSIQGFVMYGGFGWKPTDLVASDYREDIRRRFEEACLAEFAARQVQMKEVMARNEYWVKESYTVFEQVNNTDPTTSALFPLVWANVTRERLVKKTIVGNPCYDPDVYQLVINRADYFKGLYIFKPFECFHSCSGHGSCFMGHCACQDGFWGVDCSLLNCPNDFCYRDVYTYEQSCYQCSGHGACYNGSCSCDPGFLGEDCAIIDCPNNCSASIPTNGTRGSCVYMYPFSQCNCTGKYGGDDCSVTFCLNQCSFHGKCVDGVCQCDPFFYGVDCSVRAFDAAAWSVRPLALSALSLLLLFVTLCAELVWT